MRRLLPDPPAAGAPAFVYQAGTGVVPCNSATYKPSNHKDGAQNGAEAEPGIDARGCNVGSADGSRLHGSCASGEQGSFGLTPAAAAAMPRGAGDLNSPQGAKHLQERLSKYLR